MEQSSITVKLENSSHKRLLFGLLKGLCSNSISTSEDSLSCVEKATATGWFSKPYVFTDLCFHVADGSNGAAIEQLAELAMDLKTASYNPLIPFESGLSVVGSDNESLQELLASCRVLYCVREGLLEGSNALSLVPWLTRSDRMGVSLGIGACQSLMELFQLCGKYGSRHPTRNDIIGGITGVVLNMVRRLSIPSSIRGLTTLFWSEWMDLSQNDLMRQLCDLTQALKELDSFGWQELAYAIKNKGRDIYDSILLRVERNKAANRQPNQDFHSCDGSNLLMLLTEQSSLYDILSALTNYKQTTFLYTSLSITKKHILESLIDDIKGLGYKRGERRCSFQFVSITPPRLLEALLTGVIREKRIPTDILIGGPEVFKLVARKVANQYNATIIYNFPPIR